MAKAMTSIDARVSLREQGHIPVKEFGEHGADTFLEVEPGRGGLYRRDLPDGWSLFGVYPDKVHLIRED